MERYIGLDAHATSCTFAVVGERGRRLQSAVVATNGRALVEFLTTVPGRRHLCLEEGTQSAWLYEILAPHVDKCVVTVVPERRGAKDDRSDAFACAQELRLGALHPIFKGGPQFATLRAQVAVYGQVTADVVRVQNRLKARYRSRGVATPGSQVYTAAHRDAYLAKLPEAARDAQRLLYAQYDGLLAVKKAARQQLLAASHRHGIARTLETCPGMGPIRVAQLLPVVVTPHRFRTKRQFWSYCGLGIVMRSSADWEQTAQGWARVTGHRTRGLNRNFNRALKSLFKAAATAVIARRIDPLYARYERLTQQGTKPPLAKLTLARTIAATVLAMWKHEEVYDPERHTRTQ